MIEGKQLIFIGGLHRSGTSLLFKILRDHPEISGFEGTGVPEDEGQLLQSVYPPAHNFGGPGRFGFDSRAFLDEHSPLVSRANAEKLFREWTRYWDLEARFLLEKSPPNLVRARFLQALFPRAFFIMLLRHPVAVAFATRKWSRTSIPALIEHWVLCHERFARDRPQLRKVLTLKYEALVQAPERCMDRIYRFLSLPAAPVGRAVESGINEEYFQRWRQARDRHLAIAAALVRCFERRVRAFGYSLEDPTRIGGLKPTLQDLDASGPGR